MLVLEGANGTTISEISMQGLKELTVDGLPGEPQHSIHSTEHQDEPRRGATSRPAAASDLRSSTACCLAAVGRCAWCLAALDMLLAMAQAHCR